MVYQTWRQIEQSMSIFGGSPDIAYLFKEFTIRSMLYDNDKMYTC